MSKDNDMVFSKAEILEFENQAKTMGEEMIRLLMKETSNIKSHATGEAFLHWFDPVEVTNRVVRTSSTMELNFEVVINFDKMMMHRESLYPKKYPNGIQVDALFANGYRARKRLFGVDRHGRHVESVTYRPANDFMGRATEAFKRKYPDSGIQIQYSNRFRGGTYPSGSE